MSAPSTHAQLARIDAALARIERAARDDRRGDTGALAARHQRLQRATAAAVAELDAMIRARGA